MKKCPACLEETTSAKYCPECGCDLTTGEIDLVPTSEAPVVDRPSPDTPSLEEQPRRRSLIDRVLL